jgi:hypothetical protein
MRVRSLVTLIKRTGIGVCLLLVAGAASALWTTAPPLPQLATATGHAVSLPATAPAATAADESVEPVLVKTTVKTAAPRRPRTRLPNAVPTNRPAAVLPEKTSPRRTAGPRPLHPGEFGRKL